MFDKKSPNACVASRRSRGHALISTMLGLALSAGAYHAVHRTKGGIDDAQGRYSVVFPASAALPNPRISPGAFNPNVTQANIYQTICVSGYTRTIRPPVSYTEPLKRKLVRAYGYQDLRLRDYELDHLASLELGGAPSDPRNLWPQPHHVVGGWGSFAKDRLENKLHRMICKRQITLSEAQRAITVNWVEAYKRYIGPTPLNSRQHRYGG